MIARSMRLGLTMGAALALATSPALAQSTVKAGIEAWGRADYAGAVAIWRPLADNGDSDAQFNLAQAYKMGRGVTTDVARAQDYYERSARSGHLDAQTSLGLLLFQNGNRIAAMRWLKAAADKGEPRALLVLGTALFNGDGVERDPVRAYALVSRSAAQGFAPAQQTLTDMDELIPLPQRQEGIALAMTMATGGVASAPAPARPTTRPATAAARTAPPAAVKTTAPAAAKTAASGGWRIQLGAFGQRASAEALFRKLSASAPVAGRQSYVIAAGAVTRLQVGPFSRSEAAAACATLKARGQACFAVAAR